MKYWIINWNPQTKPIRSSRVFKTFLTWPEPFETYGYKDGRAFRSVEKGDMVFCYQKNEDSIVGVCDVIEEPQTDNKIGGTCIVLRRRCELLKNPISSKTNPILQKIKINRTLIEVKDGGEVLLKACCAADPSGN